MIDTLGADTDRPSPAPWEKARLAPVLCALCNHPVSHFDPSVSRAKAGGMCMRSTCLVDPKTGKKRQVHTFYVVRET